ncbi:MAG: thiazole biosynthesis adenylyltransferase ThiF [Deltaproteobacteria bacterium]|nr:MAG: thiazole biosynthesis adenylyltransferase ThiF [Deltaproteobacteria bacterium]
MNPLFKRYSRQMLFSGIGEDGQNRISSATILIIGCGALGTNLASQMVRAGVGTVKIVDRDYVEISNLQRQVLFDESDVDQQLPKAAAAVDKLKRINSDIRIESLIFDVTAKNIESMLSGVDLVLDATDNMETRYLINDACVKHGIPWIYGGVIGATGMTMDVIPGKSACLQCLSETPPAAGSMPTCETEGVLGGAPAVVASIQATEALKILVGHHPAGGELIHFDLWENEFNRFHVHRRPDCQACVKGQFSFLAGSGSTDVFSLCGRNAVQITSSDENRLDLQDLKKRLTRLGPVTDNGFFLTFKVDSYELMIFPDTRTIIKGTTDETVARDLFAKYVGT